jgi:Cu+-exporting ATPase|tara:strand:+ start:512 stop:712 length:201 start_codon:yes stop_codon:yes gene_type:complete
MGISLFGRGRATAKDPVCNMDVDTKNPSGGTWEYKGETYYFCGPGCNRAFQKEPEVYLSGEKKMEM